MGRFVDDKTKQVKYQNVLVFVLAFTLVDSLNGDKRLEHSRKTSLV